MSTDSPQVSKYTELATELEALIRGGEWADVGRAPGVRAIAARFGVSIVTASRALQLLHERGIIETIDRSGSYLKDIRQREAAEKWGLYLRVTPGKWRQAGLDMINDGFRRAMSAAKSTIILDPFPLDHEFDREDWRRHIRRLKKQGMQGMFFFPSRLDERSVRQDLDFLECAREEKLPVVLIERSLRGQEGMPEWDLICADNVESGRVCTRHLLDIGRKRIALVLASPTSTHLDREAGYLLALRRARVDVSEVLELPIDLPGSEAYEWAADRLRAFGADGVICYHDYTAVGLMVELLRRGVKVPEDLAVIGFDDYPIGTMFSLGLTTISYPMEGIAHHALRLLRERAKGWKGTPVKLLIPCNLIVRESTGGSAASKGQRT